MEEETKVEDTDSEEKGESTNWQAKYERLRSARTADKQKYESKIAELEAQTKTVKTDLKVKTDENLLERLDKMALQVAGIKEADEVELYNKWKTDTGREADVIVGNDIFKKEIENLRTAKATQIATSEIQGGGDKSGVKDNPDYWIGKATKGKDGKLEFPEETPKHLYSKILDKIGAGEPGSSENLKFYNE